MKSKNPLCRRNAAMAIPLAILLPTLGAALPADAAEHTATFETNLDGWTATEGTSASDWARRAGGTPSGYTGPSGARAGQWYLYLESSYPNYPRKIAWLQSPSFEEAVSRVTFYYHLYGSDMGALALETSADGVAWNPVWSITGQQHASGSANWTRKQIDLSGGTVHKIRFKGTTGAGYRGDMAIDQVTVTTGEVTEPPTTASPWSKSGKHIYYADPKGGNVGIGDNAPTADLSVLGNLSRALTGYVTVTAGSRAVTGEETLFTEELRVGESLLIGNEVFTITGIGSNTALTVDTAPTASVTNATAYADSDLLSVETGAEKAALVVDRAGNVGIGVAVPKAKLEVAGGIKVGSENETVCDAGKAGTIRYDDAGKAVEVCDGSGWTGMSGEEGPEGPRGAQGPRGPKGEKGDAGATGAQGLRGERGAVGPQGLRGLAGAMGPRGLKGDPGPRGKQGPKGDSDNAINAARSICYSALTGNNNHSIIMVPLPSNSVNLDYICHSRINGGWHAGGVAKGDYYYQNCPNSIDNKSYGGGYTSYVTESYFEGRRSSYTNCGPKNAFICCSPQFPN